MIRIRNVNITDLSEHQLDKACDGSKYLCTTHLALESQSGMYEVTYSINADVEYCRINGNFKKCVDCCEVADDGTCLAAVHLIPALEAFNMIINALLDDTKKVETVCWDCPSRLQSKLCCFRRCC